MEIFYLTCSRILRLVFTLWHSYCIQAYMPLLGGNMQLEGPVFWIPLQERWPVFPEFHQLRVQLRRLRLFRSRLCNFSPLSVLCSVSSIHQIHWASTPGLSWYWSATIFTKKIIHSFLFLVFSNFHPINKVSVDMDGGGPLTVIQVTWAQFKKGYS